MNYRIIIAKKNHMQKQKFFTHHLSIRLMDHEYKRITQLSLRRKKTRSVLVREILQSGIQSMITKPKSDEPENE
jgi:hypothetical protein